MIVLCDGMPRSASTWIFNVCLKLFTADSPAGSVYSGFDEDLGTLLSKLPLDYDHAVIKCHRLDHTAKALIRTGAARAIYTHRDPFDAIVSYMRMFGCGFDDTLVAIVDSLRICRFQQAYPNCRIIGYEAITATPQQEIAEAARFLGLNTSSNTVSRVHSETSLGTMKQLADELSKQDPGSLVHAGDLAYDPRTLLHRRHVRDGGIGYGQQVLTEEQQRKTAEALRGLYPPQGQSREDCRGSTHVRHHPTEAERAH